MTKILVAGATGNQGGAVIDHLLTGEYGTYDIHGLTRDADSQAATDLRERGVTVVEGDMTDLDRMTELCADVDSVFCVTTFFEAGTDIETEQGITMVDAAADADVDHFVYSSVGGADENIGLAHFDSKYAVEAHLADSGLEHTVVRPVYFMQNLAFMHGEQIADGELVMPLAEGVELAMVDAADIGETVAMAVADPDTFAGVTVEIAGDELTVEEMAARLSDSLGREITPVRIDIEDYRAAAGDEMADMFVWFNEGGYDVDYDALDDFGIECRDFAAFLDNTDLFRSAPTATR